jgi:nucleotide-binding universal stress UspA family protein
MVMLPFAKILWPTDFSEPSFEALKAANELALRFSAELFVVHVVSPLPVVAAPSGATSFNVSLYEEELLNSAESSIEEIIAKQIPDNIKTHSIVTTGLVADEIIHESEKQNIDLIVTSTHGETGWHRFVFGSVTEKVVRMAPCPVLTIHAPKEGDE